MVLVRPEDYSGENADPAYAVYKDKIPKRTLHFSDGILEEYDTDEEAVARASTQQPVDPSTLSWGPWILNRTSAAGATTLSAIDYLGESLASFFGITSSKYYFEAEEYKRRQAGQEKLIEQEKGWSEQKHDVVEVPLRNVNSVSVQPNVEHV